jgi:type VI secretion system secreted protein Hcp
MALDMFLKLTDIDGESKDDSHMGEIDVLAWSFGLSQSGTFHSGGGGGAGKANFQDLSFTHYHDTASPNLKLYCATGKHIPEAILTVRKAGDDPLEYLKYTMTKCMITSVSCGGSGGEDQLTENATINFAEIKEEYTIQKDDGTGEAGPEFAYNIEANKKT